MLTRIAAIDASLPVIVMTAWGSVELAVEAVRRGARDFITKPWENARLITIVKTQVELGAALRKGMRLEAENRLLRNELGPTMIGRTLGGRWGRKGRRGGRVRAGGLAEGVFESELFGHVRGAYTDAKSDRVGRFELADEGTLFLDEIANVPMALQAKLLRVLETGEMEKVGSSRTQKVDVRVISATNADLHTEVANNRFREDLLFRLNTIEIRLPALRERREDIPPLAAHFLRMHTQRYRKAITGFDQPALNALLENRWQGNVRELNHVIERAVLLAQDSLIRLPDLALRAGPGGVPKLEDMSLEDVEAHLIRKALDRYQGNVSQAANALGLSRSALYRRLQRYGM